jgi:hypothetical protein
MGTPLRSEGSLAVAPPALQIYGRDAPGRQEVEGFIQQVYARHYGARVGEWAPCLVTLRESQRPVAAAGFRPGHEPLFLERYLPGPVEDCLARHTGHRPDRARIVEVGHLAASQAGEGRRLIPMLGHHLAAQGYQWVVLTATTELRHLLVRMGLTPLALASADPSRLGHGAASWGSYYEHSPVVVAGHLGQALRKLRRFPGA